MPAKSRTIAVIGLGTFGATAARELARFGNHVIGIDIDERFVASLSDHLSQALILDARDDGALREAGLAECDTALIAIGTDLEANVLATLNARMIGVGTVWAKANTKPHHRILSKLGVDRVIHPEEEVGQRVAQMLHNPALRDYMALGNGHHVVTFHVPEDPDGTSLAALDLPERFGLRCASVMRGTDYIGNDARDCALAKGDLLVLMGPRASLRDFGEHL